MVLVIRKVYHHNVATNFPARSSSLTPLMKPIRGILKSGSERSDEIAARKSLLNGPSATEVSLKIG